MKSEGHAIAVPLLRVPVKSLKRLCVDTMLAHPDAFAGGLPQDLEALLLRRVFFPVAILEKEPSRGEPLRVEVMTLLKASGQLKSEMVPYMCGLLERALGTRVRHGGALVVQSVQHIETRVWENENPEFFVKLDGGRKMAVEGISVAGGHWERVLLKSSSLLQEVMQIRDAAPDLPPRACLTLVLSDLDLAGQLALSRDAMLLHTDALNLPVNNLAKVIVTGALKILLPKALLCEEVNCPLRKTEVGDVVPCPRHLVEWQKVCNFDVEDWFDGMIQAAPWSADLFEILKEKAEDKVATFIRNRHNKNS